MRLALSDPLTAGFLGALADELSADGLALTLLLEFAIQITRLHDRRKAKRESAAEIPDDQAAPIDQAEPIEPPTPVSANDDVT